MAWTTNFTRRPPMQEPVVTPDESLSTIGLSWYRPVFADTFTRFAGLGTTFGTPERGSAYVADSAPSGKFYVDGSVGWARFESNAGGGIRQRLGVAIADLELFARISWQAALNSPTAQWIFGYRWQSASNYMRVTIQLTSAGNIQIALHNVVAGVATAVGVTTQISALSPYTAGSWLRFRFRASGSSHSIKVWLDGDPEPADWTLTWTDSTYLIAGDVALWPAPGAGFTNALPYLMGLDDLAAVNLAAAGGASTSLFEAYRVYRTVNGVRELVDELASYATPTLIDWEAPTGVPLSYDVVEWDGWQESITASVQTQVMTRPAWFLVVPGDATLAFPLAQASTSSVRPGFTRVEGVPMSVRYPLGRGKPIVWSGPTQRPTGDVLVFVVRNADQVDRVRRAAAASRLDYAVLKTGRGEALAVKLGAITERYGEAGATEISVPYITVR